MERSSAVLQQWMQAHRALFPASPTAPCSRANGFLFPPSATRLSLRISRNSPYDTRRGFRSTRRYAKSLEYHQAPSLKKKRVDTDSRLLPDMSGFVSRRGVMVHSLEYFLKVSEKKWVDSNLAISRHFYERAIRDGYLPRAISLKTFRHVQEQLCVEAFREKPNAQAIRAISVDVDAVFRIGYTISTMDPMFREWIVSACAMAGAHLPTVLITARQIGWNKVPVRSEWTRQIETSAKQGYPPAMVLHAKILGLRNEYKEALDLLEKKVLPFLTPTLRNPMFFRDTVLGGLLESPWRLYALLNARYDTKFTSKEHREKSDEALRAAALTYQDADALIEYASLMMNANDLDMYEECMSKAATAGKGNACLFLANFYYLTYLGKYPTRGERTVQANNPVPESLPTDAFLAKTKPEPQDPAVSTTPSNFVMDVARFACKWVSSFVNQSMERSEYRKLANDWYYLAYRHDESRAAFMMALLAREDRDLDIGRRFLDQAQMEHDLDFAGKLQALKEHWYDEAYEPKLPKRMLEVR